MLKIIILPFRKIYYKNAAVSQIKFMIDTSINEEPYEYVNHNTWYQQGLAIKTYAGFDKKYKLPVSIEHGIHFLDQYPPYEIDNDLPGLFVLSEHRKKIYSKYTNKEIVAIGPYIHYVNSLLTEKQYYREKKRLGKVLLFMPMHSDVYSKVVHDSHSHLDKLVNMSKDFDTIRVCLHWFDVENNLFSYYQKHGWECVCAGHETNNLFMSRLKSIIECSDLVVCESITTGIGYAIQLKKPVMILNPRLDFDISELGLKNINLEIITDNIYNTITDIAAKLFLNYSDKITEEQLNFIDKYWGLSELKSKEDMRKLILYFENKYINKSCFMENSNDSK
jgi:hypothetical protein